jgi:CO/xanthine dehydrogenase FAD-binding subunit
VKYDEFHTGYKQTAMRADELIARVRLPRAAGNVKSYYRKVGTRRAQAISKVCMAATAWMSGARIEAARVALGSVAPTVVRCARTEGLLRGQTIDAGLIKSARETLAQEIAPIDDIRSTKEYRVRVAENLLEDFLSQLQNGARG